MAGKKKLLSTASYDPFSESLAVPFQRKGNLEKQEEIAFYGILWGIPSQ